ncbi:hypothetical protein MKW92_050612 [Papaver armeniacum]|nr:hypothetical protein MKW92_050612 [Papaver armeniacum]
MKLSFSLNSKSNPKPRFFNQEEKSKDTRHEYVTEFDQTKPADDHKRSKIITPPLQNSWKFTNKMSNLQSLATKSYSATDDPGTRFELEVAPPTTAADQGFKYGLTLRKMNGNEVHDNAGKSRVVVSSSSINVNFPEDRVDFPYAEALLAGYGWKKGQGIGKNAKEEVQVVQYVGRVGRQGLGYEPHGNGCREKRDHGSREMKKRNIQGETRRNAAKRDNSTELSQRGGKVKGEHSWLISHIRVRVVSKKFRGGKLYMKKGEIVDVVEQSVCDIAMDESKDVIQGVKQDILETVIPRCGGAVVILYGKHKGVFGNLVERDIEKETGVVRDADNHELLNVHLEQIAEYIGDPSHLGY